MKQNQLEGYIRAIRNDCQQTMLMLEQEGEQLEIKIERMTKILTVTNYLLSQDVEKETVEVIDVKAYYDSLKEIE